MSAITYRRIGLEDVERVAAYCEHVLEHVSTGLPLHRSPAKVRSMVVNFAIHREHFHVLAERDGEPVGALAMYVAEMPFHERCEGHVMLCHAAAPGAGLGMIRRLMRFVADDVRIRQVQFCLNPGQEKLAAVLARRWGFARPMTNLIFHKGG